jgi:uncharacterized protein involved in exopolysaccharide biosynthesis
METLHPSERSLERGVRAAPAPDDDGGPEFGLLPALNVVLRFRRSVIGLALLLSALAVGMTLVLPRTYTSVTTFMPQTNRMNAGLSGLAAQLGVSVPTSDVGQSPAFYVDLLTARQTLEGAVATPYAAAVGDDKRPMLLGDVYKVREGSPAFRRELAAAELRKHIDPSMSQKTGVVRLAVRAKSGALAKEIAERLLELVNKFNTETRQTRASAERQFTERRLADVKAELRVAEDALLVFLTHNRDYQRAPSLVATQDRLSREVLRLQQLYSTLSQSYEQAKIEEVRDTPVITVVERPNLPLRPDPRGLVKRALVWFVIGGTLGIFIAFVRASARRARTGDVPAYAEFAQLKAELVDDLRHPHRLLLGGRRRRRATS